MPFHGRFRNRHSAGLAAVTVTALLLPLAAVTLPASPAGASPTAPSCAQPALHETMVSQGLPSYRALVRGKQTLVKLFLSHGPTSCASSITVTGATMTVTRGGLTSAALSLSNATPLSQLESWILGPSSTNAGNPHFVVSGSVLSPAALPDVSHQVTFSGTVTYTAVTGDATYSDQTLGFSTSETVEKRSKPLRVLVVPMGDSVKGYDHVFPRNETENSEAVLRNAMQALHRMVPVGDGIGSVDSGSGGLRYQLAPSAQLVNLGQHEERTTLGSTTTKTYLDSSGRFCGGGSSFTWIQQKLAEVRNAWNSAPGRQAEHRVDRVLGVVTQKNSKGASTNDGGCAEGWAGVNAPEAWFRLVGSSVNSNPELDGKSLAGFLGTLETGHTLGAVPLARGTSDYHSLNVEADGTARERAYHVARREYRADDRTVMTYSSEKWHDDNVFFEKADWDLVHCIMVNGTDATTTCAGSEAVVGTATGATGVLYAAGSTDGTPGGTQLHTYVISKQDFEKPPAQGPYFVRFFAGALSLRDQAVPVYFNHSHHSGGNHGGTSERGVFDVALNATGADSFRFVRRDPTTGTETVLFRRQLDQQPNITQIRRTGGTRSPYQQTAAAETQPDVSPDGKYVSWGGDEGVFIRRTSDTSGPATLLENAYQQGWSSSGTQIAAARGGRVVIYQLDTSAPSGPPTVVSERVLYSPPVVGNTTVDAALHPSWSPDDSRIVVALDRERLAVLDATMESVDCATGRGCQMILDDEFEVDWPAWSPPRRDAPGGLIAFERVDRATGVRNIHTVDPGNPAETDTQRLAGARFPAWGGARLAFSDSRGIATVAAEGFGDEQRVVSLSGDMQPTLTRDDATILYAGAGDQTTGWDVFIVRPGTEVVVTDDKPDDLRLDVFLVCSGSTQPVATGLYPRQSGSDVVFDVTVEDTAGCPDGTPLYRATDGFQTDAEKETAPVPGRSDPVVAVATPRVNETFNEFAPVPVDLDAWGPDGSRLAVTYTVTGPTALSPFTSFGAETPDIAAYLQPGAYTLTAKATYGSVTAAQHVPFTVLADNDRDGIPNAQDSAAVHSCYPADAHLTSVNAVTDYDGDFLIGLADAHPCKSAFNATVRFEPQTVQLGSSGTQLTFTITSKLDPAKITAAGTTITRMAGHPVALNAVSVTAVDRQTVSVKFDRQAYSSLALSLGLTSGYVPVTVTLLSPSGTAIGADPKYPIHKT